MNRQSIDARLDELMDRRRSGESADSILTSLPRDGEDRGRAADLFAIEDALVQARLTLPGPGFARNVLTALETQPIASSGGFRLSRWARRAMIGAAGTVAASLLVMAQFTTPAPVPVAVTPAPPAPDVTVADTVRHGTEAYLELMESVASTVRETPSTESPRDYRLANASPIGQAILGSEQTIRVAGTGLRAGVEPITSTAMDAFGFLWRTDGEATEDPSI